MSAFNSTTIDRDAFFDPRWICVNLTNEYLSYSTTSNKKTGQAVRFALIICRQSAFNRETPRKPWEASYEMATRTTNFQRDDMIYS